MEAQTKDRSLPRQTAMICKGIHRRLCAARLVDVVSKQTSTRYFLPGSLLFHYLPLRRSIERYHDFMQGLQVIHPIDGLQLQRAEYL